MHGPYWFLSLNISRLKKEQLNFNVFAAPLMQFIIIIIIIVFMLCQFNNLQILYYIYITYQTIMAGYMQQLSPLWQPLYKTNMTRVHFKLSFTKRTYIHTLKLITTLFWVRKIGRCVTNQTYRLPCFWILRVVSIESWFVVFVEFTLETTDAYVLLCYLFR